MPNMFWHVNARVLFGEEDCRTLQRSVVPQFRYYTLIAPAWHGCLDEVRLQETPISGDELVETVVANIRLGGVCKYFRDVFSKKPAA